MAIIGVDVLMKKFGGESGGHIYVVGNDEMNLAVELAGVDNYFCDSIASYTHVIFKHIADSVAIFEICNTSPIVLGDDETDRMYLEDGYGSTSQAKFSLFSALAVRLLLKDIARDKCYGGSETDFVTDMLLRINGLSTDSSDANPSSKSELKRLVKTNFKPFNSDIEFAVSTALPKEEFIIPIVICGQGDSDGFSLVNYEHPDDTISTSPERLYDLRDTLNTLLAVASYISENGSELGKLREDYSDIKKKAYSHIQRKGVYFQAMFSDPSDLADRNIDSLFRKGDDEILGIAEKLKGDIASCVKAMKDVYYEPFIRGSLTARYDPVKSIDPVKAMSVDISVEDNSFISMMSNILSGFYGDGNGNYSIYTEVDGRELVFDNPTFANSVPLKITFPDECVHHDKNSKSTEVELKLEFEVR